eukprot:scaffold14368_cov159-Alexandrium_tamarense.AAC.1
MKTGGGESQSYDFTGEPKTNLWLRTRRTSHLVISDDWCYPVKRNEKRVHRATPGSLPFRNLAASV